MEQTEDFGGVLLAAAVHEAKNSLAQAVLALDRSDCTCPCAQEAQRPVAHASNRLTQALMLYRLGQEGAVIHYESLSVQDFLEDLGLEARRLTGARVTLELVDRVRAPFWFFDRHATEIAVLSSVHNALNHARETIRLSAYEHEGCLAFSVEDDGDGYPEAVLNCHARHAHDLPCDQVSARSTGLGLRFAHFIARAHQDPHGRRGQVRLGRSDLGGAKFEMRLP